MTLFIHYTRKQCCLVAEPLQGPPSASMPEARGNSGEKDDVSGEAGWLEKECESQPVS